MSYNDYVEFVPSKNGGNVYVPLIDAQSTDFLPELPEAAQNAISDYYSTVLPTELPSDPFIRYYYTALSIIGLYVVYRVLMTGR